MRFDDHFLEEVRAATDIIDVIGPYVKLKKKGKNWFGLCPFHNEKTPSFSVNRERGMYYCFGCGIGGNAITFLVEHDGMSFPQAVEELATRAGIQIPKRRAEPGAQQYDRLREALESAALFYQQKLKGDSGKDAVSYLKSRGITGITAKTFRLGYAPDSWDELLRFMQESGHTVTVLEQAGLVKVREGGGHYDTFRNRLVFPFMDRRSRVCGFGGRILTEDDEGPKYLNSPDTPLFRKGKVLYGLPHAIEAFHKEDRALLVEGYFDVMSLHQTGIKGVVAASGTAFTDQQALMLARLVRKVLLLFDSDPAGLKAAFRSYTSLAREGLDVLFLGMPSGEDPDTLIRGEGVEAFRSRLRHAQPIVPFYLANMEPPVEERDVGDRADAARGLLDLLRHDSDELRRVMSLQELSARIGLEVGTLQREMDSISAKEAPYERSAARRTSQKPITPPGRIESELLQILINSEQLRTELLPKLAADDFHDPRTNSLYLKMVEQQKKEGHISIDRLLEQSDTDTRNMLAALLADEPALPADRTDEVLDELMKSLESRRTKERRRRLKVSMEQAKRAGDETTLARLLKEYQEMR